MIGDVLVRYLDMMFVDLGCNIGVYMLFVVSLGNWVVFVDVFDGNFVLLVEFLRFDFLESNVMFVYNVIFDKYENVILELNIYNVGGFYVKLLKDIGFFF